MTDAEIYSLLDGLSSGDRIRIYPSLSSATVHRSQLEDPFEATVGTIRKRRNSQDSYFHEGKERRVTTGSTTKAIWFEAEQNEDTGEYKIRLTEYRDGHNKYNILIWRNQVVQRDQPAATIEDIEILDTEGS